MDASRKNLSILIGEDDEGLADSLSDWLTHNGYRVIVARKLSDVGLKLRNQTFSCAILDFRFPEGTSESIIGMMRTDRGLNQNTPIIVISGALDVEIVKRIGRNVNGVLVKPFPPQALGDKLAEVLTASFARG